MCPAWSTLHSLCPMHVIKMTQKYNMNTQIFYIWSTKTWQNSEFKRRGSNPKTHWNNRKMHCILHCLHFKIQPIIETLTQLVTWRKGEGEDISDTSTLSVWRGGGRRAISDTPCMKWWCVASMEWYCERWGWSGGMG